MLGRIGSLVVTNTCRPLQHVLTSVPLSRYKDGNRPGKGKCPKWCATIARDLEHVAEHVELNNEEGYTWGTNRLCQST